MINSAPAKWTSFDRKWVQLCDYYAIRSTNISSSPFLPSFLQHSRRPIYDDMLMLMHAIAVPPNPDVSFAAYHCFSEVSRTALYQDIETKEDYADPQWNERNLYVRAYSWRHLSPSKGTDHSRPRFGPPISDLVENPSPHLLHDENMLVFLEMVASYNLPEEASHAVSAHICELQARILGYVYTGDVVFRREEESSKHPLNLRWLLMMPQQYIDMINSTNDLHKFKVWSQFAPGSLSGNGISVSGATIESVCPFYFRLELELTCAHEQRRSYGTQ